MRISRSGYPQIRRIAQCAGVLLAAATTLPLPFAAPARAQNADFWSGGFAAPTRASTQVRRERAALSKPSVASGTGDATSVAERLQQRKANAFIVDFGAVSRMARTEPMAGGEPFRPDEIVAAHASMPINSTVLVTDVGSGRTLLVRIKDRPINLKSTIELSPGALASLGIREKDLDKVRVRLMSVWVPTGEPLFWPRLGPRNIAGKDGGSRDLATASRLADQ